MFFIIADDLTGANDSGIQLQKNGLLTFVVLDPTKITKEAQTDYDGIAINTDTRAKSQTEAFQIVEQVTGKINKNFPKAQFYKKVDSLLRGNSVAEIEGMMQATKIKKAYVAPGYPAGNRIMKNGKIEHMGEFIDVFSLFETESDKQVGLIPLGVIQQGRAKIKQELERLNLENKEIILFDSQNETDLTEIYALFEERQEEVILCGSAGMASLIGRDSQQKSVPREIKTRSGITLHVIGSQHGVTEAQVSNLLKKNAELNVGILKTDKIKNNQTTGEITCVFNELKGADINQAKEEWLIVLDSLFEESDFELKVTEEREVIAKKIIQALGTLSVKINRYKPVAKLVATGGDTALGICQAFNADGIALQTEVLPGVPSGQVVGGELDGAIIVTKSGGFGDSNAFTDITKYLNTIVGGR